MKTFYTIILTIIICLLMCIEARAQDKEPVWLDTDIGTDPDDEQSFYHALWYSHLLDIRGINSSYKRGKIKIARQILKDYRKDFNRLKFKEQRQTAAELKTLTYSGNLSKGKHELTEGARAMVVESRRYTRKNPLLILVWGSATTLASAIKHGLVQENCFAFLIGGWNTEQDPESHRVVKNAKRLRVIDSNSMSRGMYLAWNLRDNRNFVKFLKTRGAMGKGFYKRSRFINTGSYSIKAGDTPSVLWALTHSNYNPTITSWAGKFVKINSRYWTEGRGNDIGRYPSARLIDKQRKYWLSDWKELLTYE